MVDQNVPHMNAGNAEINYANNSSTQRTIILKTRPILEDTLKKVYTDHASKTQCLNIADLGSSYGPNTILVISQIIETISGLSSQNNNSKPHELQIFLNDLPKNDFNAIFMLLPSFYKKLEAEQREDGLVPSCFVSGVPGSFYGRLFPRKSIHFVHSTCSLHWLSQVPKPMENKGNICIASTSPPSVFEAYSNQFHKDFSTFLSFRSEEMIPCGRMVLTVAGRSIQDPTGKGCFHFWQLLTKSLFDLVSERLIEEEAIDSFNIQFYTPYKDEVKAIIEEEGSFNVESLQALEFDWDTSGEENVHKSAQNVANVIRAISEPILASHFGGFMIDDLFKKYAKNVVDYMSLEKRKFTQLIVSLSKK